MISTIRLAKNGDFVQCDSILFSWPSFHSLRVRTSALELIGVALIVSTTRLVENDDLHLCDSIFQIGHVLGRVKVKLAFYQKSSKMTCDDKPS